MTDVGFELTIHGLLRKRAELMDAIEVQRNHVSASMNDLNALDRVLTTLGYDGERDLARPRNKVATFLRVEVQRYILDELRGAGRPITTRELAVRLAVSQGRDAGDRGMMLDFTRRVSKSICYLLDKKMVTRSREKNGRGYQYELAR